ncbi:MAG TPA: PEGA domain-containing protein [Polyangia bacterium]
MRLCALTVGLLLCSSLASAREMMMAIAPLTTGQNAPAELQRAFSEELPIALAAAGFLLMPPNQVDMKVGERPELLQCRAGGCLAEEAAFFKVDRLALPRLDRAVDGGYTVGITVYDAGQKKAIGEGVDRVAAAAEMHDKLIALAERLRATLSRPGRLEVTAEPSAALSVDGRGMGSTPWSGELAPGDHVIALESGGARVERDVNVAPGATARVDIELSATPAHRSHALAPLKWVSLVGGVLAVGAGAALVAVDGKGTCARGAGQTQCPDVYDTRTGGYVALAAGGALVVTGVILFVIDRPRRQ